MTGDELRELFLRFFEGKGHKVFPSSSLVPREDPTLLLTNAGMVQFKPYFTGELSPLHPRPASCQKCFRTTDIESVGDLQHLTFFEMLGNFSLGDYFKKEAIAYSWEFVLEHLHLPRERLWITIFLDDDESFGYWRELGVPEERIIRQGEDNNFWGPAGDSGPCGPCTEIHYDFGEEFGCGRPGCVPGCDCDRYLELWNLVFTQYYQDESGQRTLLPKKNVDTGMGLERTAAVVQGKRSAYETDFFAPLIKRASELTGAKYGQDDKTDRALRVIADHGRAVVFLIADGVLPANDGRGYVLRRVLRRAVRYGRTLGLEQPFLTELAQATIAHMGHVYPELKENQSLILNVIALEEERFEQTLSTGLVILDEIMKQAKGGIISGEEVFCLYDTCGFPRELTAEIAAENGISVDLEGFEQEMEQQRERGRIAQKGIVIESGHLTPGGWETTEREKSEFVGYENLRCMARIKALFSDGKFQQAAKEGQEVEIALDKTPFYAEMGGQVGDSGEINGSEGRVAVVDTFGTFTPVHRGKVVEGKISIGDEVEAQVDNERRLDIARNHTATHLLHAALRQVLGGHVRQMGSLVAADRFRFDFSYQAPVLKEEMAQIQQIVNEGIRQNLAVTKKEMPHSQAMAKGAIALFDEKYGEVVRVVRIGRSKSPLSLEVCGGTHVERTGDIGLFQIVSESSIGAGLRRIEAVTGRGAERLIQERMSALEDIAHHLRAPVAEVSNRVADILSQLDSEQKRADGLERELAQRAAEGLLQRVQSVDGIAVLAAEVSASNMEILRQMGDWLKAKLGSAVIVLGAVWDDKPHFLAMVTPDLVSRGVNAAEIAKRVAQVTGGGGGGQSHLGQAGGRDKSKLTEALHLVSEIVAEDL